MDDTLKAFDKLLKIMDELRAGCPWDKKQTFQSLRYLTIEETYELSDAVLNENLEDIKKELGDLLLHIVFYAKIGSERKAFDIKDIIEYINDKLIERHPHIYGDTEVNSAEDVKDNWEKIKLDKEGRQSVLGGVPRSLPPLVKAYRIQEKARGVGFDWKAREDVWDKVMEEIDEFQQEVKADTSDKRKEEEFGDLLFSLVNYARFVNVNPEDALERTNKKFIKRFQYMESVAQKAGKSIFDMSFEEMEKCWGEAKSMGVE